MLWWSVMMLNLYEPLFLKCYKKKTRWSFIWINNMDRKLKYLQLKLSSLSHPHSHQSSPLPHLSFSPPAFSFAISPSSISFSRFAFIAASPFSPFRLPILDPQLLWVPSTLRSTAVQFSLELKISDSQQLYDSSNGISDWIPTDTDVVVFQKN